MKCQMEFSFGGRFSSTLQMVALIVFFRENVSSEIVQDCVGSLLSLRCPEMKVIKIMDVVLGHFECLYESCCIKDRDCVRTANKSHRTYVNRRCDNKQSCSVEVLKANVTCGYSNSLISNNFERITYNCRDKARNDSNGSTGQQAPGDQMKHGSEPDDSSISPAEGQAAKSNSLAILGIVIVSVVCLIVVIAIVASVSIVRVRRKTRRQLKSSDEVKGSELGNGRKEAIYMNESQEPSVNENSCSKFPVGNGTTSNEVEKSLNNDQKTFKIPTNEFCELPEAATGRIQSDNEYEELDDGINYEPLVVYEQLQ